MSETRNTRNDQLVTHFQFKQPWIYMLDAHSANIYKWLEWIAIYVLELSFCEKSLTRSNSKLQPIIGKTLKKYMFLLLEQVELKIFSRVRTAQVYSLVFGSWSEGSMHFIGSYQLLSGWGARYRFSHPSPLICTIARRNEFFFSKSYRFHRSNVAILFVS
jgi:hypothetical protein